MPGYSSARYLAISCSPLLFGPLTLCYLLFSRGPEVQQREDARLDSEISLAFRGAYSDRARRAWHRARGHGGIGAGTAQVAVAPQSLPLPSARTRRRNKAPSQHLVHLRHLRPPSLRRAG